MSERFNQHSYNPVIVFASHPGSKNPSTTAKFAHNPGMLATISLNYIAIASQERIAGWLKGLHRNWVDCRTTAEDHDHVSQFLNSTSIHSPSAKCSAGIVDCSIFLQITPQCRWISRQTPNLMQSFTIRKIAEGIGPGLWLGSDIDTDTQHKGGV